jgi:hypothetical protein
MAQGTTRAQDRGIARTIGSRSNPILTKEISNVGYVAIGSGDATLASVGVGRTLAGTRRRHRRRIATQSTITA